MLKTGLGLQKGVRLGVQKITWKNDLLRLGVRLGGSKTVFFLRFKGTNCPKKHRKRLFFCRFGGGNSFI